jgi:hypothetical protein
VRSAGIINHHLIHVDAGKKRARQEGSVDSCEDCLAVRCSTNAKWICLVFLIAMIGIANADTTTIYTTNQTDFTFGRQSHNSTWAGLRDGAGNAILNSTTLYILLNTDTMTHRQKLEYME